MIKRPKREWNSFVTLCLEECLHRNNTNKSKDTLFEFYYLYDGVEIILVNHDENDVDRVAIKSVSVSIEEYEAGNVDDDILIERLFKTLS